MHLVQREHLPESANGDQKRKHKQDNNQQDLSNSLPISPNSNTSTPGCCDACSIS